METSDKGSSGIADTHQKLTPKGKTKMRTTTDTKAPHGWLVTVKATGEASRIPFNPKNSIEQLQTAVAGYIELLTLYSNLKSVDCFCNDEGKIKGLPVNGVISTLYGRDLVCGDVVICKHDEYGDTIGLTDDESRGVLVTLTAAGAVVIE